MRSIVVVLVTLALGMLGGAGCGQDERGTGLLQSDGASNPGLDGTSQGEDLAPSEDGSAPGEVAQEDDVTGPIDVSSSPAEVQDDTVTPPDAVGDAAEDASDGVTPLEDATLPPADVDDSDGVLGDVSNPDAVVTDTTPGDTTIPPDDGCPIYQRRCEGGCIQTNLDPMNCGGCGVACDSGDVCSAGACKSECLAGLSACNGSCADFSTDRMNCGSCSHACAANEGCVSGSCVPGIVIAPPPGGCAAIPPFVETIGDDEVCLGNLAQRQFTWGICACESVSTSNVLRTDAYDSRFGPWTPGGTGGGLAMNGNFRATNKLTIGGTLWVGGAGEVDMRNVVDVAHAFYSRGPLSANGATTIGLDAHVAGRVEAGSTLAIGGTLFQPEDATISGSVSYGARVLGPVTVDEPCRCEADDLLPVAAIVATHTTDNDNAAVGLNPAALMNPSTEMSLTLPCGRYYLTGINTSKRLSIVATGRTALFIGGDIVSSNELQITIAPGAELDLFVGGVFDTNNKVRLGSPNFPALMRIYIGGNSTMTWNNDVQIGAYLYAGQTGLSLSNKFNVFGGIFVRSLSASNEVNVHYDRAILGAGVECEQPPTEEATCETCVDCANQACVDGLCGSCATSADCCGPLVCVEGQCLSLGISIE